MLDYARTMIGDSLELSVRFRVPRSLKRISEILFPIKASRPNDASPKLMDVAQREIQFGDYKLDLASVFIRFVGNAECEEFERYDEVFGKCDVKDFLIFNRAAHTVF